MTDTTQTKAGRRQFILLTVLFFAPLVAAYLLYFVLPQLRPEGTTNKGTLVRPIQPLPALHFADAEGKPLDQAVLKRRWSVVYVGGANCDDACLAKIIEVRQVRLLLANDRSRVQRVYIAPDAAALQAVKTRFGSEQPDLVYLADTGATGARAADFFKAADPLALYVVDPLGNWMMVYKGDAAYKDILKDLKYLLKLSNIG